MNRWKVELTRFGKLRHWCVYRAEDGFRWCQHGGGFSSHARAIAYADRMARSIQVEIPREPHRAGRYTLRSHQAGIQLRHKDWPEKRGEMTIAHTDVKDLALALLAHHYRAVDNPR